MYLSNNVLMSCFTCDLSHACSDFGLQKITRNVYETLHGRGPQDAAGGFIKRMADAADIRGSHIIQNDKDLYDFSCDTLIKPSDQAACMNRIFR